MIELDDSKDRLQIDLVHAWLASSYWSPGIQRQTIERAIKGSHCLGAYRGDRQVGFARSITDHTTFAWISDVWVAEEERGQGLGRKLVRWYLDHPDFSGVRRFGLTTADAHGVYEQLGFHRLLRPESFMERLDPDYADRLRSRP